MADIFDREFEPVDPRPVGNTFVLRRLADGTNECLLDGHPIKMLQSVKLEMDAHDLVPHLTLRVVPGTIEACLPDVQLTMEELDADRQQQIAAAIREYQQEFVAPSSLFIPLLEKAP